MLQNYLPASSYTSESLPAGLSSSSSSSAYPGGQVLSQKNSPSSSVFLIPSTFASPPPPLPACSPPPASSSPLLGERHTTGTAILTPPTLHAAHLRQSKTFLLPSSSPPEGGVCTEKTRREGEGGEKREEEREKKENKERERYDENEQVTGTTRFLGSLDLGVVPGKELGGGGRRRGGGEKEREEESAKGIIPSHCKLLLDSSFSCLKNKPDIYRQFHLNSSSSSSSHPFSSFVTPSPPLPLSGPAPRSIHLPRSSSFSYAYPSADPVNHFSSHIFPSLGLDSQKRETFLKTLGEGKEREENLLSRSLENSRGHLSFSDTELSFTSREDSKKKPLTSIMDQYHLSYGKDAILGGGIGGVGGVGGYMLPLQSQKKGREEGEDQDERGEEEEDAEERERRLSRAGGDYSHNFSSSASTSFGSSEEFEIMVSDLRRTFISWLKKTESDLKKEKRDLLRAKKEFDDERKKAWERLQEEKENEYEKIKEERRKAQAEMTTQLKQIQIEREASRRKLNAERGRFEEEKEAHRRRIVLEREKFRQEAEALDGEKRRIVDTNIATETVVDLNVGGVIFESSRHTLVQQPGSFLEALLSGRHHISRDKQGRIFLDRDSELFRILLNFLRNPGTPPQP
ncbi:kelch repeat and k+ channel tetramerization domain containing protein, partial [Cystoisospora suis]